MRTWLGVMAILSGMLYPMTAHAAEPDRVLIPAEVGGPTEAGGPVPPLQALIYKPADAKAPTPVVVALHGCGGNLRTDGRPVARVPDWADRLTAAGYSVIWPDSFGSRGLGPQCTVIDRTINPLMRANDARRVIEWVASQPAFDASRIALLGWSNGGSTVLRAVETSARPVKTDAVTAIAFYPGCRPVVEQDAAKRGTWATRLPLTILMGGADDWTPPEPCRALGQRASVRYIEYPGAYHDFDAPNRPVRVRTKLTFTANRNGVAHAGTDPAARAAAIQVAMDTLAAAFKK